MNPIHDNVVRYRDVRSEIADSDLLLFRRRGLISIAGRGNHSHAAKAAWWDGDLFCLEIREWKGGRAVTLSSQVERYSGRIDVFRSNPENRWPEYDRAGASRSMRRLAGCDYGYRGVLAAAVLHLPIVRLCFEADVDDLAENRWPPFCSQACVLSDRLNADVVCLQFTASGAVPERFTIKTTAYTAALAARLATAIPNAAPGVMGGLPTVDDENNLIGGINGSVAGDVVGRILGAGESNFVDYGVVAAQATDQTPLPTHDQVDNLDAKLGDLAGTGNNTVLGMFQALALNSAAAPSDLGGTYAPASHSLESIKSGLSSVRLSATGLDSIPTTAPTGVAGTFREILVQTWRRFFRKSTLTGTHLKTYADDGSTVLTTQNVSDDLATQTQGTSA